MTSDKLTMTVSRAGHIAVAAMCAFCLYAILAI